MAKSLWGNVYFKDAYAGRLEEKPGGRYVFTYDQSYLNAGQPDIAYTLPARLEPYLSENGLHAFFDNLVAEGWYRDAQARALGVNSNNRFALLLGFGYDLAGAVSIIDPEPSQHLDFMTDDQVTLAALSGRASLSGVQRKLLVVKEGNDYRPVKPNELSTHIAKLASGSLPELLELELLTTAAAKGFLPHDEIVEMKLATMPSIGEQALIISRFDRSATGKRLYHFEEFNQLLAHLSDDKYEGDYEDMGKFISQTDKCIPADAYRLFCRILVCLLVGNTDAHLKNFAMFHTQSGLRLTPLYDVVASSIYEYQSVALRICGTPNLQIGKLSANHLIKMSQGFGLQENIIENIIKDLRKRKSVAIAAVEDSDVGSKSLKNKLVEKIEKRWNGSFELIGKQLLKKQSKGVKRSD